MLGVWTREELSWRQDLSSGGKDEATGTKLRQSECDVAGLRTASRVEGGFPEEFHARELDVNAEVKWTVCGSRSCLNVARKA